MARPTKACPLFTATVPAREPLGRPASPRDFIETIDAGRVRIEEAGAMILSNRFWRRLTFLVRLDMAAGTALAVGLLLWLQWN
jgi:hypothetical protein